jgi:excisionase family DNA binding protein
VKVVPVQAELTTQEAADILNVSRPYLIELLEKGTIPYHKVGAHRRVPARELLAYKEEIKQLRLTALEELSALDQELGLGY